MLIKLTITVISIIQVWKITDKTHIFTPRQRSTTVLLIAGKIPGSMCPSTPETHYVITWCVLLHRPKRVRHCVERCLHDRKYGILSNYIITEFIVTQKPNAFYLQWEVYLHFTLAPLWPKKKKGVRNHASFEENSLLKDLSYPIECVPIHKLKIVVVSQVSQDKRKNQRKTEKCRKIRNSVKTIM